MMGHPQETREDIPETLRLSRRLSLDRMLIGYVTPLPGSDLFQYYCRQGHLNIPTVDWETFTPVKFIPHTEYLTTAELTRLRRSAYFGLYENPCRPVRGCSEAAVTESDCRAVARPEDRGRFSGGASEAGDAMLSLGPNSRRVQRGRW